MKKDKRQNELGYIILTPIMRVLFRLWYNPKIINKKVIPKEGPIIIACNHKHIYDQCLAIMSTKRPIHYMAKKEYFEGNLAWFFKLVGCISVDRQNHDKNATEKAINILNNNGAIGIFPEGTRNKTYDKILLDFKFGTVSMAQKTNATIIPCCVTGDYKFRSKNLIIRFGTPFKVSKNENLERTNKYLYRQINRLINNNLYISKRTIQEEINSHNQDKKKNKTY